MSARLQPRQTLRAMTVGDLAAVVGIEARAYSFPWSRGNFVDSLAAGYLAELLAIEDGAAPPLPVGYYVAMPGVDELHLLNLTVAPDWQGQGLGQALLEGVVEQARALGSSVLWLEVRQSNHRARLLYRRRGFDEVGLRRGYYPAAGRREDAIVMRLALSAPPAAEPRDAVD